MMAARLGRREDVSGREVRDVSVGLLLLVLVQHLLTHSRHNGWRIIYGCRGRAQQRS